MAAPPRFPLDNGGAANFSSHTTAVGVDRDKNSQHAVRWAIEHLILPNHLLALVHVSGRHLQHHDGAPADHGHGHGHQLLSEADEIAIFGHYRGYCARKGIMVKEIVLEDHDPAKALLDYVNNNYISNVVVGASTRNALTRRFKNSDIAASLNKFAPDFCAVYVIAKGKVMTVKSAQRTAVNTATPPRQPYPACLSPHFSPDHHSESEDAARAHSASRGRKSIGSERVPNERASESMKMPVRERPKSTPTNLSLDNVDLTIRGPRSSTSRSSFSDDGDFTDPLNFGSLDMTTHNMNFSGTSDSSKDSSGSLTRELETEMRRLKLELKQTMDMYSTACKEAISAKKQARELSNWKMDEARRFEEARLAEEAALAIAEIEKAKCKAAIEAAEASQKLAEMEVQRRRYAELKAKRETDEKNRALNALAQNDVRYRKYTIDEIEAATENFVDSLKIGEGGYGPVYKGRLDHTEVAIKVLRPDAAQGRKQFQQEVEVLSCIRHPNMVLLLGACPEYGCLVYEYMNNGSLEDRLFQRGGSPPLPCKLRFKIAAEIATALLFLHQAKPEPLVHRDLKPANILLDRNYVSKISDVGLARLVPPSVANSVTQYHMTSAAGTFCYIDPEYQQTGMLGIKSDIYSLGIVLLQIITGRPPMALSHHVERAIDRGMFADILDPTVHDWPIEETLCFAKLALKCSELRKRDRPDLGTVILPEIKRIRDLGNEIDSTHGNGYMHCQGSYAHYSASQLRFSNSSEVLRRTSDGGTDRGSTSEESSSS
ncbi:U-box domain-containing protein 35 isoform X2 [Malania oleifera]|uniref:U-box domain-containing protein 35 isoform X2 n=1 Tax=Malania oleifera TaxID=397392 RepID=UPI0025ADEAB6|nr:U-box domain-containing protein 35 isoform X2 [Malania oleifera]